MTKRISARAYAELIGVHEETVTRWCRNAVKGFPNKNYPVVKCFKRGSTWMIDVEGTERAWALVSGNPIERDAIRRKALAA